MIDEALIKITVNTEDDSVKMEIINPPEIPDCTHEEYVKSYPAHVIACRIVGTFSQTQKTGKNVEKKQ